MVWQTLRVEASRGWVRIALHRPDHLNSVSRVMRDELIACFEDLAQRKDLRVVLLTASGKAFCTGQDLNERYRAEDTPAPDLGEALDQGFNRLVRLIRALPQPVICGINGVAAGAGANLALACDVVIAARSARFIQSFSRVGLMPDSGGSWWLPHRVGHARAAGLALLADPISAETAAAWGLIWRCVADEELQDECERTIETLMQRAPLALAAIKTALQASGSNSLDAQLDLERDLQQRLGKSQDYREGVAAFMEKRNPNFEGK
ncbi:MAG: 2-(1,2-epoxy-1,2-dihydrophenyl)acetyl-CoA isomerase [Proteobacteria bacterium]|nr:MAG: 2-(1,2-epoxy-1,2-dihydrophenyl)acetyl-CoA isomerase [Pseudomonadota bacterium]